MALYCMWSCNQCGLLNYDEINHCQACFNKTTQKSAIYSIQKQQRVLFDAFIRTEVVIDSQHQYDNIPTYLLDFCFSFFGIDIKLCIRMKETTAVNLQSVFQFGRTLLENREYFFSYQILSTLIKYHPDMAALHNAIGVVFANWDNPKDAISEYEKAIEMSPRDPNIAYALRRNYGVTLMKQKKWKLAIQQFEDAYKLDTMNGIYPFKMAICYEHMKNYELSNFYFLKSIELTPSEWKYCWRYAKYLRDSGQYEEAHIYYNISLEMNPKQKFINSSYAYLLYLMRKMDEAQKYIELALDINDGNYWAHYYQGLLHKEFGKEELATESLEAAIKRCNKMDSMLPHLEKFKREDPKNTEYHDKCAELLRNKFKSM
eukprot:526155_1